MNHSAAKVRFERQPMPCSHIRHFLSDQSGAVTVDWVVLTASIVGMSMASVAAVRTGVEALGTQVQTSLSTASVAAFEIPYSFQGLTSYLVTDRANAYANTSTAQLVSFHRQRAAALISALDAGHHTPTGNWSNLSAGETLDILYLHSRELIARGEYPVDGVPSFDALHRTYKDAR